MPEAAALAIANFAAEAFGADAIATFLTLQTAFEVASVVSSIYTLQDQQRKAQNAQRDAYNASLRDRYSIVRAATVPRTLVLGRQRVSGPIFFIGSYGANLENLIFCVALAGHEIDAVESIYFDDHEVILNGAGTVLNVIQRELFSLSATTGTFTVTTAPNAATLTAVVDYGSSRTTLGVSVAGLVVSVTGGTAGQTGTVTIKYQPANTPYTNPHFNRRVQSITLDASGNGSVTLTDIPDAGTLTAIQTVQTSPDKSQYSLTYSLVGTTLSVSGGFPLLGTDASVSYTTTTPTNLANIKVYLGAPGQTADPDMIAALPAIWSTAHTVSGIAYLRIEATYDPSAFPNGFPSVSAVIRGAKVYDPRTSTTAWSENAALLLRHAATHTLCGGLAGSLINDSRVSVAANVCDTSANYVVNGQTFVRALYTAASVHRSGARPMDTLNDFATAMAGRWTFTDGLLCMKAGAWVAPLQTIDETWLSDAQAIDISPSPPRASVYNTATGTFADQSRDYRVLDYPRVQGASYIAADGKVLEHQISLNAVTFVGQAQQVVASQMRDARQGMTITLLCNNKAYPVEVFDVVNVTIARFGWVNLTCEVLDVSWTVDGGIQLILKQTASAIFDLGAAFTDFAPAPATAMPSALVVPLIAGLTLDGSAVAQLRQSDGTVAQRVLVSWTPVVNALVRASGGGVEIRYGMANDIEANFLSAIADGSQSQLYLTGVHFGSIYQVKARAFNGLVKGAWSAYVNVTTAAVPLQAQWNNVTGTGKPSDNASSDVQLLGNSANAHTITGNSISRASLGTFAASDSVYSVDAFAGGAFCSFVPTAGVAAYFIAGLSANPNRVNITDFLQYDFIMRGTSSLEARDGGAETHIGTYTAGSVLAVVYDGVSVRYVMNGVVLRTVAAAAGLKLGFQGSSSDIAGLRNIRCGAMTSISGVVAAAAAAQATADGAATNASAALATLTDIASDNVLTPNEKPQVILDVSVINAEQAGIDAQAANYVVTTEVSAYDAAVSALANYLATLTSAVLWSNLSGNTAIVGTTFRSKFSDLYGARQAVLNKISANAKARLGALATLNTVGTATIDPNAATDIIYSTDALCNDQSSCAYTPFTPAVSCTVTVTAESVMTFANGGATDLDASYVWIAQLQLVSGTAPVQIGSGPGLNKAVIVKANSTFVDSGSTTSVFTVTGGSTYAFSGYFGNSIRAHIAGAVSNARLHVQIIKR